MANIANQNFNEISTTIQNSKQKVLKQVNSTFITFYWKNGAYYV